MSILHTPTLAGSSPANVGDLRVSVLSDLLFKGVSHLELLRSEGVAKTNFMQCDERSIYVFEYLFKSPYEILDAKIPPIRRSQNHSTACQVIDFLRTQNQVQAASELSSVLIDCDPNMISDQAASTEIRINQMIELHTLIFGILCEVLDKRLSASLTELDAEVRMQSNLPDVCYPGLAYMPKSRFIGLLALRLNSKGYTRAAEIVLNQKGRPI